MHESKLRTTRTPGYRFVSNKQLDSVVLPAKITCRLCEHQKTAFSANLDFSAFSNKQLDAFKNGVATRQITHETELEPWWIACKKCTGTQKTEMFCTQCQHWLGLDGFTRAQRKTPDNATCIGCVYKNQMAGPMIATGDEALRDLSEDEDSSDFDDNETNPFDRSEAGGSESGVPISGSSTHRLNDENLKAIPNAINGAGSWQQYAGSGSAAGQKYTAYDPQGRAHEKIHNPSVADTEESYATTRASRVTDREMKNLTSKFARRLGPRQELAAPAPYVGGRTARDDDDDNTDSDDSYGCI